MIQKLQKFILINVAVYFIYAMQRTFVSSSKFLKKTKEGFILKVGFFPLFIYLFFYVIHHDTDALYKTERK